MTERRGAAPSGPAPLRALGTAGLLLAVPVVLLITLWPSHVFMDVKPQVVRSLEWMHERELFEWLYWTRLEVLANVAMLVPVALMLTFIFGARRFRLAVALCIAGSMGVELVQYFMPGRVASVRDIVANGLGACIGALLATAVEAILVHSRRTAERRPSPRGVTTDS